MQLPPLSIHSESLRVKTVLQERDRQVNAHELHVALVPLRTLGANDLVHLLEQGNGLADSLALPTAAVEHEHDTRSDDDLVVPRQRIRGRLQRQRGQVCKTNKGAGMTREGDRQIIIKWFLRGRQHTTVVHSASRAPLRPLCKTRAVGHGGVTPPNGRPKEAHRRRQKKKYNTHVPPLFAVVSKGIPKHPCVRQSGIPGTLLRTSFSPPLSNAPTFYANAHHVQLPPPQDRIRRAPRGSPRGAFSREEHALYHRT